MVWNSFRSTLRAPSNLREAVIEDTIWEMSLFRLVYEGRSISKFLISAILFKDKNANYPILFYLLQMS